MAGRHECLVAWRAEWLGVPGINFLLVVVLATIVALGVLAYLYYERTRPVAKIDVPGVSGEITKEGVHIEVGKPKGSE